MEEEKVTLQIPMLKTDYDKLRALKGTKITWNDFLMEMIK